MSRRFVVPLRPKAKERPRHKGNIAYTPKATKEYEEAVRYYYERDCGAPPTSKPVMLTLCFNFAVPKSVNAATRQKMLTGEYPYPARPDLDNVEKAIMDALNKVAFADDAQIVAKVSLKRFWYSDSIMITIDEMEEINYADGIFSAFGTDRSGM